MKKLRQTEEQIGSITKDGVLPVTTFFFLRFWFSVKVH